MQEPATELMNVASKDPPPFPSWRSEGDLQVGDMPLKIMQRKQ